MVDMPGSGRMSFAELLVNESPDALIALRFDGRIRSWNRGAAAMFGYTVDEAVGSTLEELIVPDDRRAEARAAFDDAIHKGSILIETVRRCGAGTLIHLDESMQRVAAPDTEPFVAVSKRDVTQLKHLQHQQATEDKFGGLLEA